MRMHCLLCEHESSRIGVRPRPELCAVPILLDLDEWHEDCEEADGTIDVKELPLSASSARDSTRHHEARAAHAHAGARFDGR